MAKTNVFKNINLFTFNHFHSVCSSIAFSFTRALLTRLVAFNGVPINLNKLLQLSWMCVCTCVCLVRHVFNVVLLQGRMRTRLIRNFDNEVLFSMAHCRQFRQRFVR